jgi:23S rRNA pseudouridine2605 synthase
MTDPDNSLFPIRFNKYIAHAGICSRRKAADLIKEGKVKLNDKVHDNPATLIGPDDKVYYKDKLVTLELKMVYLLLNKPKNVITTLSDERGRKTVMDIVGSKVKERIYPVGRLDRATTGLLLLTNDGDLAKKLSHPSHQIKKIYQVELDKDLSEKQRLAILDGLTLEDGLAIVDKLDFIQNEPKNKLGIEIHMGKNRIIRRIFEHIGREVIKLDRVYYAGLTKKDLPRGWSRFLSKREVIMLKHFI